MEVTSKTNLNYFDVQVIRDLVRKDIYEHQFLEFKAKIKERENTYRHQVRQAIASFANADGGFIFFGLKDSKSTRNRIIGEENIVDPNKEIAEKFLESELFVPPLSFNTKKIRVNSKYVYVMKIETNEFKPFAVRSSIDKPLEFWYREGSKKKTMDLYTLIIILDLSKDTRIGLKVLYGELEEISRSCELLLKHIDDNDYYPHDFEGILSDSLRYSFRILSNNYELIEQLHNIRINLNRLNKYINYYFKALVDYKNITLNSGANREVEDFRNRIKESAADLKKRSKKLALDLGAKYRTLRSVHKTS